MTGPIELLLRPKGVAIVGASRDPHKHGSRVVTNLRRLGFEGPLWAVNPHTEGIPQVDGIASAVTELPQGIDTLVCAIPGPAVAEAIRDAGKVGIGAAIVFSAGFAEAGPEGAAAQRRLVDAAVEAGVRLLGPNSGGVVCPSHRTALSFLTWLDRSAEEIRPGPVGLVTQSGGTGSYVHNLAAARGGGLAASLSTGNEADLGVEDAIVALAEWEAVKAVAVVLETVRRGPEFGAALAAARQLAKPVVVCRLGRRHLSATLLQSHTGALAIGERVLTGLLDEHGVVSARTPEEMLDVAEVLAASPVPRGGRVGIVTHSGGTGILLADLAFDERIALPAPSPTLASAIEANLQSGTTANPADLGSIIGGPSRFANVVRCFRDLGDYDAVLAVSTPHPPTHTEERAASLAALHSDPSPVPIVNLWMAGDLGAGGLALLRSAGVPVIEEPRAAMRALAGLCHLVPAETATGRPAEAGEIPACLRLEGEALVPDLAGGTGVLSESRARRLLANFGVPSCDGETALDAEGAVTVAERLGFPVVLKADAPGLPHKSALGAVRVDLRSVADVRRAFEDVTQAVVSWAPEIRTFGVLVTRFEPGLELLVGCASDPVFGPVAVLGLGGTTTEVLDLAVSVPLGSAPRPGRRLLERLGLLLSRGLDGLAAATPDRPDWEGLIDLVDRLAYAFASGQPLLAELEVNPLIWTGRDWRAADAMVHLEGVA